MKLLERPVETLHLEWNEIWQDQHDDEGVDDSFQWKQTLKNCYPFEFRPLWLKPKEKTSVHVVSNHRSRSFRRRSKYHLGDQFRPHGKSVHLCHNARLGSKIETNPELSTTQFWLPKWETERETTRSLSPNWAWHYFWRPWERMS